jgi:MFS family permease
LREAIKWIAAALSHRHAIASRRRRRLVRQREAASVPPLELGTIALPYAWYVVGVLVLANACAFLDRMIMGLLVGPIRASLQINDTQFSLLAGLAFSVFYALMGIPLARLADAGSRRALITAGIVTWSAMTALCALARGFWSLFAARVGVGVGEATVTPAAFSLISDYFPTHLLGRASSVYMMGVTLGSGLAYMIGGSVVGLAERLGPIHLPFVGPMEAWQLTFVAAGLPGVLVAALMRSVREPRRRGALHDVRGGVPLREVLHYASARRRAYGAHIFGTSLFVMVVYALNLWGPTYLIRVFGLSREQAGWACGVIMMLAGTAGLVVSGALADGLMRRGYADGFFRVILLADLAMLPFVIALGSAGTLPVALAALTLAIFFSAFQGGLAAGALQLMTPNQMRGQAVAVYLLVANLIGLGLGPTVVAACTDFVFHDDAAIGKSLALAAAILCPACALILYSGLGAIRSVLGEALAQAPREGVLESPRSEVRG